jgi:transcriptional regulator NrdR family protein
VKDARLCKCGSASGVHDSRGGEVTIGTVEIATVWRRRHCDSCGARWTTLEMDGAHVSLFRRIAKLAARPRAYKRRRAA